MITSPPPDPPKPRRRRGNRPRAYRCRLLRAPLLGTAARPERRDYLSAHGPRSRARRLRARARQRRPSRCDDLPLEANRPRPERLVDAERHRSMHRFSATRPSTTATTSVPPCICSRGMSTSHIALRAQHQQEDDRARHGLQAIHAVPVEACAKMGRDIEQKTTLTGRSGWPRRASQMSEQFAGLSRAPPLLLVWLTCTGPTGTAGRPRRLLEFHFSTRINERDPRPRSR